MICPVPDAFFPLSKQNLRAVMKTAALDAEEHRERINAVLAAHQSKHGGGTANSSSSSGGGGGGGGGGGILSEVQAGAETDPLIRGASKRMVTTAGAVRGAAYIVLPAVDKVSTV